MLRKHRNPNSYVAGGVAIHRSRNSLRCSNDIDFFHDTAEAVQQGAQQDMQVLAASGYQLTLLIEQPAFIRATISRGENALKLEWVRDTAFRFFPVIADDDLGYRLHDVDLAVNKCLTLANRAEVRDIIDIVHINDTVISLACASWAACGKDPGFTPLLLLDCMNRNSIIRPEQLASESLAVPLSATELKQRWRSLFSAAVEQIAAFSAADLGCIYLDREGRVVRSPDPQNLADHLRHFGSVGGSWPRIAQA